MQTICGKAYSSLLLFFSSFILLLFLLSGCGGGSAEIREVPAPTVPISHSSPAIIDTTLYVGASSGVLRSMVFSNTSTAPVVNWELNIHSSISTSPALSSDGTIYFGADNGRLYAIDSNAAIQWVYDAGSPIHSSPAVDGRGRIYFGSDSGNITALDPSGNLLWNFPTTGAISSSPSLYGTSALFIGSDDQKLYTLDLDGGMRWSFSADEKIQSSPAIDSRGRVLFGTLAGTLYSLDFQGSQVWSQTLGGAILSSPILDQNQNVFIGSEDGFVYGFDSGGNLILKQNTGGAVSGAGTITTSSELLFGSSSSEVLRLTTSGTVLERKAIDSPIGTSPNIAPGYGFFAGVSDQDILWVPTNDTLSSTSSWPRFRGNLLQNGFLPCLDPGQIVDQSEKFGTSNWGLDSLGQVQSKDNADYSGLLLGSAADDVILETTLFTNNDTSNDDDTIGLIIAANRDGQGNLHTLSAVRSPAGGGAALQNAFWGIVSVQLNSADAITGETLWVNGLSLLTETHLPGDIWNDFPAGVQVRVEKNGTQVKANTSSFDRNGLQEIDNDFELSLDLNSNSYLQRFIGPTRAGFTAHSQPFATFANIQTAGGEQCVSF